MGDGLVRRAGAEFAGTGLLLAGIVGSGVMATRLTDDGGLQLLINAFATAAVLVAAITTFGPVSGAHLNPAVTLVDRWFGGIPTRDAVAYVAAQVVGAIGGVMVANLMFDLDPVIWSTTARDGSHLWFAEVIATAGLVLVIFGVVRSGRTDAVPYVVGAFIAGAFFFTSSTSFANPAVTIGRMFSDTFAGIDPGSVAPFLLAEAAGTGVAYGAIRALFPDAEAIAADVVVPHES